MVTQILLTVLSVGILGTMTGCYVDPYPYYSGAYYMEEQPFYGVRRGWRGHRHWYEHGYQHGYKHRPDFHGLRHHHRGFSHGRR
jgi:hypothetical protein